MAIFSIISFLILIGVGILYLMTLQNTLLVIAPANRKTEPSSVWLMFIPLFNIVWQFILYKKLTDSINAEYRSKGVSDSAEQSYKLGIGSAVTLSGSSLIGLIWDSRTAGQSILSLIGLVTWIAFWIQINNHKNKIMKLPSNTDGDSLIFND